jgi:hypothetical protein
MEALREVHQMEIRPSLQKSIASAVDGSPFGRVALSTLVYPDRQKSAVDLLLGPRRFYVCTRPTLEEAKATAADLLDSAALLVEDCGGVPDL